MVEISSGNFDAMELSMAASAKARWKCAAIESLQDC